jgi:hypothetical protein
MRPGYKTTEFWLSFAASVVGALIASGIVPAGGAWDKAVGLVAMVLSSLGYAVTRATAKAALPPAKK